MFPEQEAEDEDIYDYEYIGNSRKLPKNFKVKRPRIKGIREMMKFKDDTVVECSRYSVLDAFENSHIDYINEEADLAAQGKGIEQAALEKVSATAASLASLPKNLKGVSKGLEKASSFVPGGKSSSLGKSAVKFLLKSAGIVGRTAEGVLQMIPGLDIALGVILGSARLTSLALQYVQFSKSLGSSPLELSTILNEPPLGIGGLVTDSDMGDVLDKIKSLPPEQRAQSRNIMEGMLETLKLILIDIIESADSIIALLGLAGGFTVIATEGLAQIFTGVAGWILAILPVEKWLLRMTTGGSLKLEKLFNTLTMGSLEKIGNPFMGMIIGKGGPLMGAIANNPVAAFAKLALIYRELSKTDVPQIEFEEQELPEEEVEEDEVTTFADRSEEESLPAQKLTKKDLVNMILGRDETLPQSSAVSEGRESKNMSIKELRKFIRESLYPDYGSYHPPLPTGYEYRDIPVIVSKDSEGTEFDVLDDYDDVAVAYKADAGVTDYQPRNKLVKETALRRLIRNDILSALEESKKKDPRRRR